MSKVEISLRKGDEFLPITENGYEYQMSDGIRNQLTKELLHTLHENVAKIFNVPMDEMDNVNDYSILSGTGGWDDAFYITCEQHNKQWLYEYWSHLPWYESDMFSGDVSDMMVKHRVIPEGEPYEDEFDDEDLEELND